MNIRVHNIFVAILTATVALSANAEPNANSKRNSEFLFSEIEGKQAGPNAFLKQHAIRQSWPANIDNAFRAQASEKAHKAFSDVKFRGTSKGRQGVWQTVGPITESDSGLWNPKNSSGRVTGLAIGNTCTDEKCRLYAATAGGGLWRTDKAMHPDNPGWKHLSNGLESNNIGSVSIDPNDASGNTLYVGTGETNFGYSSAAGKGLFKSTDGGDQFVKISTMITDTDIAPSPIDFTATRGISQVVIKPGSPDTIYLSTTTAILGMTSVRGGQSTITGGPQAKLGLYKTTDGGNHWELLFTAPINTTTSPNTPEGIYETISGVKDIQLDPQDPDTVYISVADDGLYRASPAVDNDSVYHRVFEIVSSGLRTDSYAAFDLTVKDGLTRIYLYNGNGWDQNYQDLYRLEDSRVAFNMLHTAGNNTAAWVNMTQPFNGPADLVDWRICNGQCVYDLVVAVPDNQPDTVYLGGQLSYWMGDPMVRSTDGGDSFQSMQIDLQEDTGTPHVDVRAVVFSPENPAIAFFGSDGGLVRTTGTYGDGRYHCATTFGIDPSWYWNDVCQLAMQEVPEQYVFMNRGLQSMQLFNISADPNNPLKRMMAGTQDNSTQWHDGTASAKNWTKVFGVGDGTSANGFHPQNPNILFASFQSNYFFTHFNGGIGGNESWLHTAGPIRFSGELPDPVGPSGRQFITFEPSDADTQYTGFEHVWRTQNNGGDQSFLETSCRLNDAWNKPECGDWQPLGPFLTRDNFGEDRVGGVIVAAERSRGDSTTLWSATSLGRIFVSKNISASAENVQFDRLDNANTPSRFISGIAVDNQNPNRAFVSYSGFSAVTPGTPGHIFEISYDGEDAVFTSIDYNLGDMPITHLVRDDVTGDLYAATDFGVLVLSEGSTTWEVAGAGLPEVLTPHLEIHAEKRMLFAATHGMGAWYMNLSKQKKK